MMFENGGEMIRKKNKNNTAYFCVSDIYKFLQLKNPAQRINDSNINVEKFKTETNGGEQSLCYCNYKDAVKIIVNSKRPLAHRNKLLNHLNDNSSMLSFNKEAEFFYKLKIILKEFKKDVSFLREYKVLDYRVDLFIPDYGLIVEYDELYHKYRGKQDKKRECEIKEYILSNYIIEEEYGDVEGNKLFDLHFIRVKYDKEEKGIAVILKHLIEQGL